MTDKSAEAVPDARMVMANRIKTVTDELNEVICDACENGMLIEVDVIEHSEISPHGIRDTPIIVLTVMDVVLNTGGG